MSDKAISEIVGRQAEPSAAPETGTDASPAAPEKAAGATPAAEGGAAQTPEDLTAIRGALDKERDLRAKWEKDFKRSERTRQQETAALRRELEQLRASAPKPDPKASEDAFWASSPPEFIDQRLTAFQQQQAEQATRERVEISKELARDRYEDFEDAETAFLEAAEKDPSLWQGVNESKLPALVVYKKGKKILAGGETSPMSEIVKLRAEIAELRAGRDGGQTSAETETVTAPAPKPSIPKSNVGTRGSGVGKSTSWAGPTDIENVFGRRRAAR
jgi:hypothetical protein